MELMKLLAFSALSCCMAAILRAYKPEIMVPFVLAAGTVLLLSVLDALTHSFAVLKTAFQSYGLNTGYVGIAVKVIAIAYMVQFAANMCRDVNESALAGKVEMAGRVLILSSAVPVVLSILETLGEFTKAL